MNSSILEQRNRFALIGVLMTIVSLMFLFYMGSSLVSSTKKYLEQIRMIEITCVDARLFHLSFELGVPFPYPCQCGMGGNTIIGNQCVTNISNLNFSHF